VESLLLLSIALYESGGKDDGMALARRAVLVYPDDWWLNQYLQWWCLIAQPPQYDQAILYCTACMAIRPRNVPTLINIGRAHNALGQHDKAIAVYSQAIELDANSALAWLERADAYATRADWAKAAADFAKAFEVEGPADPYQWFHYALVQLQLGDVEGYRKVCGRMRDRFGSSRMIMDISLLAHTCVMAPGALGDSSLVRQLAEQRMAMTPPPSRDNVWSIHVLGLTEYRAGQYAACVGRLEKALKDHAGFHANVLNWLVFAMAEQRLGRPDLAKDYLDMADNWIAVKARDIPKASGRFAPPDYPGGWREWLMVQLLRREAGTLIEAKKED